VVLENGDKIATRSLTKASTKIARNAGSFVVTTGMLNGTVTTQYGNTIINEPLDEVSPPVLDNEDVDEDDDTPPLLSLAVLDDDDDDDDGRARNKHADKMHHRSRS
jgi:hypothetical protein